MTLLWVCAAPLEGAGLGDVLAHVAVLGVGKAAAAHTLTRALVQTPYAGVVVFGVAGVYLPSSLAVGDVCVVRDDVLVDEGVATEQGFLELAALGLGDAGPFSADASLCERVVSLLGVPSVRGATVSTCSGTDALAFERAQRSGAQVETMEGAALGFACRELGVPWVQLRAISNRTGERARAGWDLPLAITRLHEAVRRLAPALARNDDPP